MRLTQERVAAMEGPSESYDSDVGASLSYKRCQRRIIFAKVNGVSRNFLVDSGSDITVVEHSVIKQLNLRINTQTHITRSIGDKPVNTIRSATAHLSIEGHEWKETIFVKTKLCDPAILGSSALPQFELITITYQGLAPPLVIASNDSLPVGKSGGQNFINLEHFPIVTLEENASPIRCPSCFRSEEDQDFIRQEIKKLAEADVIEKSQSPWRAQVVVSKRANHKKLMCLD